MTARDILKVYNKWNNISKYNLVLNVKVILYVDHHCRCYTDFLNELKEITGVSKHTAVAWLNMGRDTKISFLRILEIASYLEVDIEKLLTTYEHKNYRELYKAIKGVEA